MKTLLVWPNKEGFGFKPISLSLLSGALKAAGHTVELFDTTPFDLGYEGLTPIRNRLRIFKPVDTTGSHLEKQKADLNAELGAILQAFRPDVMGISVLSDEVSVAAQISAAAKEWNPHIRVVWGNKAPTMSPDRCLSYPDVDYLCIGEGIEFFPEFLAHIEQGRDVRSVENLAWRDPSGHVHCNRLRPLFQDLDGLPFLDWTIFDKRHFCKPFDGRLTVGGDHMISWGCPYSCSYCINHAYRSLYRLTQGAYVRWYDAERIITELQSLVEHWGLTFLKFHDEDFCLKPLPYFRKLAADYRNRVGIPFTVMANARNITPEKVSLLREMSCISVSMGIETGNAWMRNDVLRRRESREQIINAFHLLNDAGIRTCAFNMLGVPHETRETIMETIQLNRDADVQYPDTVFFYPLEGTDLFSYSIREGFYTAQDTGDFDDIHPNLKLPDLPEKEIVALRERFVLYVKLPHPYHEYIRRSETDDEIGRRLMERLCAIYDEAVLAHNGRWDRDRVVDEDIRFLRNIADGRTPGGTIEGAE